ncbi:MAG: hypothetical protein RLZZ292_1072 [Bacteroidota bacterium]|jgi:hypothetical protein
MKKIIILICLTILLKPAFPVFEYVVNYDYIKTEFCVNKATPIMGCDGKCYLVSELAKSADAEKPISDKKINFKSIEILFFQPLEKIAFHAPFFNLKSEVKLVYSNLYAFLKTNSTFHPPTFIA